MKPTVYIETTIPSYLTAWPSKNVIRAAHQKSTQEWWDRREEFQLFTSELVLLECRAGDAEAAALRLQALENIDQLEQTIAAAELIEALTLGMQLPQNALSDAVHIATSAVHRVQYLLMWNCRHIANATLRPRIESICRSFGWQPPIICTPEELSALS